MMSAEDLNKLTGNIFIEDIIDGMYDWVRVIDRDHTIIYLNRAMAEGLGTCPIGRKCYTVLGKTAPCENCISRNAIFDGKSHEKEEVIGDKVFSVMSSPLKNQDGSVVAAIEVLRDVTQLRQMQNKILEQNRNLQRDLNYAKRLQHSLLPWSFNHRNLAFAFQYSPCESLGGDFLDVYQIDEDHLGIYIADVSGHGVPASMLTVFLQSSIDKKLLSPAEALTKLYRDFNNSSIFKDLYMTVFYIVIDLKQKAITYANAGHNVVPIIFKQDGFKLLSSPGIPISDWLPSPDYKDKTLPITQGDRLFLYTDGVVELRNPNHEQFGEERLLDSLLRDRSSPQLTLEKILAKVRDFAGTDSVSQSYDDITMALLEFVDLSPATP